MKDHPTTNDLKELTFSREFTAGNDFPISLAMNIAASKRFHKQFSCTLKTNLFMYLIILQCGDIEIQPGPERYPCGICSKRVTWKAKAIQCEDCEVWYHSNCANIGPKTYSYLGRSSVVWICNTCRIPNEATCTFLDLDSFSSSNPFGELSEYSEQTHTSTPIRNLNLKTQDLNLTRIPQNGSSFSHGISHVTDTNLNFNKSNGSTSSHENSVITEPESSLQSPQQPSCHSNE